MRVTAAIYKRKPLRYVGMFIGCLIAACSINLFVVPSHLLTGGVAGISMIIYYLFELPIGVQTFLYNIPLLIASYKILGKSYTVDVIIGTGIFSFCIDATRFLNAYAPVNDVMLASIFGGVFNGLGYGIVFRMNGSTGGFDIVGAIVRKLYSMNMGAAIFAFNCLIVTVAAILFGVVPAMYTLICMYVNSHVTDKVIAGLNRSKAVFIISDKSREIANAIMNDIGRGVTFLHGEGAFSGDSREIAMVIVSLTQLGKLKIIVNTLDINAFMIIMSTNEVMGRGFTRRAMTLKIPDDEKISPEVEEKLKKAMHEN